MMDKIQKVILLSIISIAAISWIISKDQQDMMISMMNYNPIAISLFTINWTIGMAAMMFPAITPMVLLYSRLIKKSSSAGSNRDNALGKGTNFSRSSIFVEHHDNNDDDDHAVKREKRITIATTITTSLISIFTNSINIIFFVSSYILVWAMTGIVLLLVWSIPTNYFFMHFGTSQLQIVYGIVLIISGIYQFSPLKTKCLGYCESPLSFFMRRWRNGTIGAAKMGIYHGLYCLGCCWPYFLLMVALGWMNLLWMALFAAVIFGEKIWSKGIWIARSAGVGLAIVGSMTIFGIIIIPTIDYMNDNNNLSYKRTNDSMYMDNMNMDKSKNLNPKKVSLIMAMPNMITMNNM
jgi:predicted metal-binding membrane protein